MRVWTRPERNNMADPLPYLVKKNKTKGNPSNSRIDGHHRPNYRMNNKATAKTGPPFVAFLYCSLFVSFSFLALRPVGTDWTAAGARMASETQRNCPIIRGGWGDFSNKIKKKRNAADRTAECGAVANGGKKSKSEGKKKKKERKRKNDASRT